MPLDDPDAIAAVLDRYEPSDLVFNGRKDGAYVEADAPSPLGASGRSEAVVELAVIANWPATLVARTAAFFVPHDRHNFAKAVERSRRAERPMQAALCTVRRQLLPSLDHAIARHAAVRLRGVAAGGPAMAT